MGAPPCCRGTKAPRVHKEASDSPSSSFARLFLPRKRSQGAERKSQSSFGAGQEPFTSQPRGARSRAVRELLCPTRSRAGGMVSLRDGRRDSSVRAGAQISSPLLHKTIPGDSRGHAGHRHHHGLIPARCPQPITGVLSSPPRPQQGADGGARGWHDPREGLSSQ